MFSSTLTKNDVIRIANGRWPEPNPTQGSSSPTALLSSTRSPPHAAQPKEQPPRMGPTRNQNQEKQPTSRYHGQIDGTHHQPYIRRVTTVPVSFGVPVTLVSMDALQCIAQDEEKGFMVQPLACLEAYVIRG
ncbi:unnamed protein product [Arctia plantaginis]|uniref:Uncharacterized protein n=1 Tax=Arctia plantaginis TaxID=874455 RepID=A0A8S0YPN9_ARCPL|nr:unnamed protein product [Arctia plantaginis]